MIENMIISYARSMKDNEYKKLRALVIDLISEQDAKRGLNDDY